jgi:hypothetical protein
MDPDAPLPEPSPSIFRWMLGFLLVGAAWGLTTPFIRKAAVGFKSTPRPSVEDPANSWLKRKILGVLFAVIDLLRRPSYAIPLVINLTGSVWFFLLIGQAGESAHNGERDVAWIRGAGLTGNRVELDGTYHELSRVHVHGAGRVAGGGEGDCER